MKYLFRSAMRSIGRSPFQTIILIFTVFLSAVLFTMISEMSFAVVEETRLSDAAGYGNADIVISTDGDADSAYIGSADVATVLDDGDAYSGYMILSAYDNDGTCLGAVTDFYTIDGIFDFSFTEYADVTSQNIGTSMFVSAEFAQSRGLSVGDEYTVNVLGVSVGYTVTGINAFNFFGTYSFIVDARGVLDVLIGTSPVFAVFDESNIPFNSVYVCTADDVAQKVESINASLAVKGWTADSTGQSQKQYMDLISTVLIPLLVMFTAAIAGVLVYFSMNIISERRKKETAEFILVGTSPRKVAFVFFIETLLYIVIGSALGIAAAAIILPRFGSLEYVSFALRWRDALICVGAELLVEAVAFLIYILRGRRKDKVKNTRIYALIPAFASVILLCVILSLFIKVSLLYIISVVGFVFVVALIFAVASPVVKGTAKIIAPAAEKSRNGSGVKFSLALKNCANISEVRNVLRILSILLSVIIAVIACLSFTSSLVDSYANFLDCDYIVVNGSEAVAEKISAVEGTQKCCVCGLYTGKFSNGVNYYLVDCDDSDFIYGSEYYIVDNGVYLPKTAADLLDIVKGDEFAAVISGVECLLVLEGYTDGGAVGYFNADFFGLNKNIVLVQASGENYLTRLSESVSVYGAFVQTRETVFGAQLSNIEKVVKILGVYMCFMCAISAVGAVNLVGVSYARRKKQFKALEVVGMTRGGVAGMIAFELLTIAVTTVIISAVCGFTLCFFLNNGMRSFGFAIF